MSNKGFIGGIALAVILIIGLICSLLCIEKIPVGYEGVVYSMNGGVQKETLTQGWHFVSPTKKVKEFAISEEQLNLTHDKGDSFQVSTSDNAGIAISFQMSYHFVSDKIVDTYSRFRGMDGDDVINNRVKTVLKSKISEVTANYSMMDIYSGARSTINKELTKYLNKEFYDDACSEGQKIILPQTEPTQVKKQDPIGEIRVNPDVLSKILKPSDSYSSIDTLVNAPFDYLMGNMGGLAAPEDDQELNENLMKGPIAHKVVELLVNKNKTRAYLLAEIQSRFDKQYDELFEQAMEAEKECAEFLKQPENKNMLALFKEDAKESIKRLIEIIKEKDLKPLGAEYEFSKPFGPFDNPHG